MRPRFSYTCVLLALAALCIASTPVHGQLAGQRPDPALAVPKPPDPAGAGVITRGPIHEAFAEPVNSGAVTSLVVPKRPPQPIREEPADSRPADDNAVWNSGYWGWDDDRSDFIWVSGIWRVPPPGHRWIPGYWTQVSGGFEWVPGFWWPAAREEIVYYPQPPESQDQGPTGDPPSPDSFWIPGCWQWSDAGYVWQPGQWADAQPGWMWVSASYYWSPQGWVFRDGYWDYPLSQRGLAFAPAYFAREVYLRPGFTFSPSVAIDPLRLIFNLFVRPRFGHYYFGDYYAAEYDRLGIYPWFSVFEHGRYAYDPIFSYYGWYFRSRDPKWIDNLRSWHAYYRAHADQRPPHDLAGQERVLANAKSRPDQQFLAIAQPIAQWRDNPNAPVRVMALSPADKGRIGATLGQVQEFRTQRAQLEANGAAGISAERKGTPGTAGAMARTGPQTLRLRNLPTIGSPVGISPRVAARPERTGSERLGPTTDQKGRSPALGPAVPGGTPSPSAPRTPGAMPRSAPGPQPGLPPRPEIRRGQPPAGESPVRPGPPAGTREGTVPRETLKPIVPSPQPRRPESAPPETRRPAGTPSIPRTESTRPAPAERPQPERSGASERGDTGRTRTR